MRKMNRRALSVLLLASFIALGLLIYVQRYLIDGADYEEVERNYKVGYQLWQNKSYKE